jgi:hypothetical protein
MKELTDEQMDILFMYYLVKPSDETLKDMFYQNKKVEGMREGLPVDMLKKQGYTDAQIERMKADLAKNQD